MLSRYALRFTRPLLSTRTTIFRNVCSSPSDIDEETVKTLQMLSDENNKPVREVIISQTGEELLELGTQDPFDESYDWDEFERRFGIHDVTDEEIDQGWEELKKNFNARTERVVEKGTKSKRARPFTRKAPKKIEGENFSIEFVDDDEEYSPHTEAAERAPEKASNLKPRQEKSSRFFTNTAEEITKVERVGKQPSTWKGGKQTKDPIYEQLFAETDALKQPLHKKRPGYERRVMSMERQMERIVENVLCKPGSEWCTAGGDVERVMLSSNMKNLTIYYNIEGSERNAAWWKKMNATYAGEVRAALASSLETKYVPRVFFDKGSEASSKTDELDALFHRIESERAETDAKRANDK